jgi:hypothetical protein
MVKYVAEVTSSGQSECQGAADMKDPVGQDSKPRG